MINNIKSNLITTTIFNLLKDKKKLKIIKHNKEMLQKLKITKEDFEVYIILKEFNDKYHLSKVDIDSKRIFLKGDVFKDEGFDYMNQIGFRDLIQINLNFYKELDLNKFTELKYKDLKVLSLCGDEISDINALVKFDFPKLKTLVLGMNF